MVFMMRGMGGMSGGRDGASDGTTDRRVEQAGPAHENETRLRAELDQLQAQEQASRDRR